MPPTTSGRGPCTGHSIPPPRSRRATFTTRPACSRRGLNPRASTVLAVAYSGVIGADRIWHGQSPYGHFPQETVGGSELRKCGPADSAAEVRDRVQANGRCETANPLGDTY